MNTLPVTDANDAPKTLTIKGRVYTVEGPFDREGVLGVEKTYTLKGPRGASYSTMRNVPNFTTMFLIDDRGFGVPAAMTGVWLSDKSGELVVL